jgi:inorganic phosphate transporter, PiT family
MFSRDNLFFGGIFVLMTTIFLVWGFDYLENNYTFLF